MHKPSHLREAFLDFLDPGTPVEDFTVEHDGEDRDLDWLLGQLWTCTDILPASYCDQLDMPKGSTYAQAVRRVKEQPEMFQ